MFQKWHADNSGMTSLRRTDATVSKDRLFRFNAPPANATLRRRFVSRAAPPLERLLRLTQIDELYSSIHDDLGERDFLDHALEVMNVRWQVSREDLSRIPTSGPLVVVANHPFGAIEGVILASLLRTVRPDTKVMVNYLLSRIPDLRNVFVFVDPFGNAASPRANVAPLRQCLRHLHQGGALAVFPAGEVAHLKLGQRQIVEAPWHETAAGLVRRAGAPVLPIYFEGHNGPLFQFMGLIHPRLRTAMLPRELLNKRGQTIRLRIGSVIPFSRLDQFEDERKMTSYIRKRTFVLQYRPTAGGAAIETVDAVAGHSASIVESQNPNLIQSEVAALSAEQTLAEQSDFVVHVATAKQIPATLNEIGRLREVTFRATGEGTGKSIDLDKFDADYLHLFVWHKSERRVVGAYRLGQTDVILAKRGLAGLYTQTLFDYDRELLNRLGPALEMGRSFVRAEYQRTFTPLLLLWKGIALYAAANPRYRVLFGGVSISNNYQTVSKQLLAKFLQAHHASEWGQELVRPRNPFATHRLPELEETASFAADTDGDLISDLIADIEPDQKKMPILIRQYLKLGAKFLAFNVDPSFGNCVDGLMTVDLARTEPRILERYMGTERMKSFIDHHAVR